MHVAGGELNAPHRRHHQPYRPARHVCCLSGRWAHIPHHDLAQFGHRMAAYNRLRLADPRHRGGPGWGVALPLVLSAVLITAGSELERLVVRPGAEVQPATPAVAPGETIVWKTIPQPALVPPSASLPLSPLLARAQENQAQEKTPKLTSKPDKCKLRRSRARSCRRRG
jgi:hypothetical protein